MSRRIPCPLPHDICRDCDGEGVFASGRQCRQCDGRGEMGWCGLCAGGTVGGPFAEWLIADAMSRIESDAQQEIIRAHNCGRLIHPPIAVDHRTVVCCMTDAGEGLGPDRWPLSGFSVPGVNGPWRAIPLHPFNERKFRDYVSEVTS